MSYLVIVESPSKARTISRFLGRQYRVKASQGHLIDLPKSRLGIDIDHDFTPRYITIRGKGKILKELREAGKKAKTIFLAADPDREGEAICWHLSQALGLSGEAPCRVEFNEITPEAIKRAFKEPRPIDLNRVDAQQARRILDRLVGYQISPLLWRKVRGGLSAGRVQSVAVRLICDREDEINRFIEREYWTLEALLEAGSAEARFKASLSGYRGARIELENREQAGQVMEAVREKPFTVRQVRRSVRRRRPSPPFSTSTLQQDASSKLGFSGYKTMTVAQQLYEGIKLGKGETVGLVTYIRTDSFRVSQPAREEVRRLIAERYGPDFIPDQPPVYRSRRGAQEAHEAIRPTAAFRDPETVKSFLTRDQFRLYKLIWDRFTASQMAPARYDLVTARIDTGEYTFRASGSTLRFPGFMVLYQNRDKEEDRTLPPLEEGQAVRLVELLPEQHFTQPPPRYSEASLIKTLEEQGIGRPSTYAPTLQTIAGRGYVEKENKTFAPTELGRVVVELLKEYFPEVIDVGFTARMERQLDEIAEGEAGRNQVLREFYQPFQERLQVAEREMEKVDLTPEISEETCPECGRNLIYRHGRFGRFLACPGFPECRFTKREGPREIGVICPVDGGALVERRSKRGRIFYGCANYPQCRFSIWKRPLPEKCPRCGSLMVEATSRRKPPAKLCSNKECAYSESLLAGSTRGAD